MFGCDELLVRADNGADGIVAALFEGAEDAHHDGLTIGSVFTAVAVAVFSEDDGRVNRSLGVVIVKGNALLIQEREQVASVSPQAFDQTLCVGVFARPVDHLGQTLVQTVLARDVHLGRKFVLPVPQANGIADQSPQLLDEFRPMLAWRLVFLRLFQIAQQMHEALLPCRADDRVVRAPKVGNQRAVEFSNEKLGQSRTAARSVDHKSR